MFDTYNVRTGGGSHYHTHNVKVTEKKAPTDESVRLLREMETAAKEEIVKQITVANNIFNCAIHVLKEPYNLTDKIMTIYDLNGIKYKNVFEVNRFKGREENIQDWHKSLAEDMVSNMLKKSIDGDAARELFSVFK